MTIEELNTYYDSLCEKKQSENPDFVLNGDRAHNAIIECFMLDNSNSINMYCGEMSVFRDGFYTHINQNNNAEQMAENGQLLGDQLKSKVIKSLSLFVDRANTSLNIYFERFDSKFLRDLIAPAVFRNGISTGKIRLFKLDDNLFLKKDVAHTSYTDTNIVRIERDPKTHEAICAINATEDIMAMVKETFASMELVGEEIKYLN